jgi:hypothetical protein
VTIIDSYWIEVNTVIEEGMMTAASYFLCVKGVTFYKAHDKSCLTAPLWTALGALLGLPFILRTNSFLDRLKDVKLSVIGGTNTFKIMSTIFVIILHSFSERLDIGVSFGGSTAVV